MTQLGGLERVTALWRARVGRPALRAGLLLLLLSVILGAHLARRGTLPSRAGAALAIVVCSGFLGLRLLRRRRDLRQPHWILRRLVVPGDPALGQRALRALGLFESSEGADFVGSRELAGFHWQRVAAAVESPSVRAHLERRSQQWRWVSALLSVALAAAIVVEPFRIVEGVDVFLARAGRAPLALPWLELRSVTVRPPAYLRQAEHFVFSSFNDRQPMSSIITVRGIPARPGRRLVLTDGVLEVPFVEDGSGAQLAHWKLERDTKLFVAARFGAVIIPESDEFPFRAELDLAPEVNVENTPRVVELATLERLELNYAVSDDHGLRQVDLVLKTSAREERRTLTRLDGETRFHASGSALLPSDPFFRSFLPVSVTIEARDNDPASVRWGSSLPVTVTPLEIGKAEALRLAALEDAAQGVVAWFGDRQASSSAADARAAAAALNAAVRARYLGLALPNRFAAFLGGQSLQLARLARPGSSPRAAEDLVLAVDSALRALARQDAENVAKRLGDVAEELALAAEQLTQGELRTTAPARLEAARVALALGLGHLGTLGALGEDLAGVGRADLGRIERLIASASFRDVERAARHLAARLRRPQPSFGATSGGSGEGGGVESGASRGGPGGEGAEQLERFNEFFQELKELVSEHAQLLQQAEDAQRAGQDSSAALGELANAEARLADRAANLAHRGDRSDTPLPAAASQALADAERKMHEASRQFASGEVARGVESQRTGQQLLQEASTDTSRDGQAPSQAEHGQPDHAAPEPSSADNDASGEGRTPSKHGDVPSPSTNDASKGFRERVLQGLQHGSGRLAPAVRRYAEGLLQ